MLGLGLVANAPVKASMYRFQVALSAATKKPMVAMLSSHDLDDRHQKTSLARTRISSGIVRPRTLAVVVLIIRSNLTGCSTGISAGLAPRKILLTKSPARRNRSGKLGP